MIKKLLSVVSLAVLATSAHAQNVADLFSAYGNGRIVGVHRTADDTDPILLVKYVGGQASATVEVSAAGDITLKHGAVSSEAADTTVKCPTGGSSGVIDVSDSSCDTLLEVINAINASDNWIAVPHSALLSDDMNCGGSGCLLLKSATLANSANGVALYADTDVIKTGTVAVMPSEFDDIKSYLAGAPKSAVKLNPNPFVGRTFLASAVGRATYDSGSLFYSIYQVKPNCIRTSCTETVTTILNGLAGGATTVDKVAVALSDNNRIVTDPGTKLIVRFYNSTAFATFISTNFGYFFTGR